MNDMNSTPRQNQFGVVIISTYTEEITIAFGIPVDEIGSPKKMTQGDEILLYDFMRCFGFKPVQRNNAIVFNLENPVIFDEALKSNIVSFVKTYLSVVLFFSLVTSLFICTRLMVVKISS